MKTITLLGSLCLSAMLLTGNAQATPFGTSPRAQSTGEDLQLASHHGQRQQRHQRQQQRHSQRHNNAGMRQQRSSPPARYSAQQPQQQRRSKHRPQRRHSARQQQHRHYKHPPHHQRPQVQHHHHYSPPPVVTIRQKVYSQRHHFKRGPALPRHVVIVQGRPMPRGWGKPLPYNQVRHLPHYPGYEWQIAGRDLILIAATTGIVYAILDNVL
ncbi:MAG: hypothetical protein EA348_13465 [Pseudomonadaceae bacterium]|nr:MAG: hypothetical protein EA348_13465 [Pseudomonadaceae bacterium]